MKTPQNPTRESLTGQDMILKSGKMQARSSKADSVNVSAQVNEEERKNGVASSGNELENGEGMQPPELILIQEPVTPPANAVQGSSIGSPAN